MVFKANKRFIAGAVCPRCSLMDTLVTYSKDGKSFRECVSCGFSDEMRFQQQGRELDTRVNITDAMKKAETQVLTLEPNAAPKKH